MLRPQTRSAWRNDEWLSRLLPEEQGIENEDRRCDQESRQVSESVSALPGKDCEARDECRPRRSAEERESGERRGERHPPPVGGQERPEPEREEQALAVDGLEEQRVREDAEEDHRAQRDGLAEAPAGELVEQARCGDGRGEGHEHTCHDVVPEQHAAEESDERGVERVEGRRRLRRAGRRTRAPR